MPSSHLILCCPLLLMPPIPPSIRVFSNGSTLCMRWPKYWSFSFSISLSNEHPGLISFRMDWLDLLALITDGIPGELFQILKDDAVKVLHSVCQQIWKTQQWPQDWKRSVFIPIPKKGNAKDCSNYRTIALISHASEVMLKILQAKLQQYINCKLPVLKLDLEKAEEPEIRLPTSVGSLKKQENSRNINFCFID